MGRAVLAGFVVLAVLALGWLVWPRSGEAPAPAAPVAIVRADDTPTPAATTAAAPAPPVAAPAPSPTDRIPEDPEVRAAMIDPAFDPAALYRRLRSEPIERPWADKTQRAVEAAFAPIPYLRRDRTFRIACAATLCEVRGQLTPDTSDDNSSVAMQALQGERLNQAFTAAGLERVSAAFGGRTAMEFTMYLRRR